MVKITGEDLTKIRKVIKFIVLKIEQDIVRDKWAQGRDNKRRNKQQTSRTSIQQEQD